MTLIEHWIKRVTNDAPALQICNRTGIPQGTYWRQVQENKLTPQNVVLIARAYGASALWGLVSIGLLDSNDIVHMSVSESLSNATDRELVEEMLRRVVEAETETHTERRLLTGELSDEMVDDVLGTRPTVGGSGEAPNQMTDAELQDRYRLAADTSDAEQDLDERTP